MISFDQAIAILRGEASPLGIETTRLAKAGRRVLAEAVRARIDAPRYDASAMDGFALVGGEAPRSEYRIVGASYPGRSWDAPIGEGQAVRIMTGAAVPIPADRVIPIECALVSGDRLQVTGGWPTRRHVRSKGSDVKAGEIVLESGTMLDPRSLLVAAAADVAEVRTWRRPVVSVIASGDELAAPGEAAERPGAIPDSLSEAILLMARQYDAKPDAAVLVADDGAAICTAADHFLADCDVLVLVGGASRGDRDFAKAALAPLGLEIRFADVAMKPGKPIWYGRIGHRHVLGLPGNPTAAMTTARLFLVPLIRALGGRDLDGALAWRPERLVADAGANGDRESFLCGRLADAGVAILERQSASSQLMLARADVLVRLPPGSPGCLQGQVVDALKF